jgi:hypothetical protein
MGRSALIHREKVRHNLEESYTHLRRLDQALDALRRVQDFPIDRQRYQEIVDRGETLAYSDQVIYRFSKLQDCMGAKLFRSLLAYQGENTDRPFLDLLNRLEQMGVLRVEEWYMMRDLRNEIAHNYDDDEETVVNILNTIESLSDDLHTILDEVSRLL